MVVFFGLAASDTKKKWHNMVFSGILFFAAFSQVLIFSLFSSSHCGDQFWADFLSLQEQLQATDTSTTCEMGTGGWFAIVAFVLFLFSALLVATKWLNPGYKVCTMEWTKDHTGDPGHFVENTGNDEEAGNRQPQSTEAKQLLHPVIEQTMTDEEDDEYHEYHHGGNKPDPSMANI